MIQRGNTLNPARKFVVRLTLATGATIATVMSAQMLALLDQPKSSQQLSALPSASASPVTSTQANAVQGAAPKVVIIRNGVVNAPGIRLVPPKPKLLPPSAEVIQDAPSSAPNAVPASNQAVPAQQSQPQVQAQPQQPQPAPQQPAPATSSSK